MTDKESGDTLQVATWLVCTIAERISETSMRGLRPILPETLYMGMYTITCVDYIRSGVIGPTRSQVDYKTM